MRRSRRMLVGGAIIGTLAPLTGCHDLLAENVVIGLREGALIAAEGIIEGGFNTAFGLESEAEEEEESADDLFING